MNVGQKIQEAWHLTQFNPKLRWFGFIPAVLSTLVGVGWLVYQYAVIGHLFFGEWANLNQYFTIAIEFAKKNGQWSVALGIISIIVVILYLLLPSLFQGGLIYMTSETAQKRPARYSQGVAHGVLSYLRVFEFHSLISPLSVISVISLASWMVRWNGWETLAVAWPVFVLLLALSFGVSFFFSYVDYFLVLQKKSVFDSMGKSAKMVILNLPETALMMVLMLFIAVRILINIVLILFIPIFILVAVAYFSSLSLGVWGFVIAFLVALVLVGLVSYLNATINAFATAVWVLTFHELYENNKSELDDDDD